MKRAVGTQTSIQPDGLRQSKSPIIDLHAGHCLLASSKSEQMYDTKQKMAAIAQSCTFTDVEIAR